MPGSKKRRQALRGDLKQYEETVNKHSELFLPFKEGSYMQNYPELVSKHADILYKLENKGGKALKKAFINRKLNKEKNSRKQTLIKNYRTMQSAELLFNQENEMMH